MALGKSDEPIGGLVLTIPWPLSGEIAEEARLRGQDVLRSIGTMGRLWLATSRAKRAGLERGERVGAGTWTWVDGEPAAHNELIGV